MAPNYPKPKQAEGLSVDFETNRTHIKVTWKAIDPSDTGLQSIHYYSSTIYFVLETNSYMVFKAILLFFSILLSSDQPKFLAFSKKK